MSPTICKDKTWMASIPLLAMVLVFSLGCGASSEPAPVSETGAVGAPSVAVGSKVGDRVTPFTLRLVDGTTLTSGDLLSRNRPTLLFFFKKG